MKQWTFDLLKRFDAAAAKRLIVTLGKSRVTGMRIVSFSVEIVSALGIKAIYSTTRQWQADGQQFTLLTQSERTIETCHTLGDNYNRPWKSLVGSQQ